MRSKSGGRPWPATGPRGAAAPAANDEDPDDPQTVAGGLHLHIPQTGFARRGMGRKKNKPEPAIPAKLFDSQPMELMLKLWLMAFEIQWDLTGIR